MTQSFKVALVMRSTLSQWFDVVNVFRWRVASFGKTHLAERMLGCVSCSDNSPCRTVAFPCLRITLILLLASCLCLSMLLAEPAVSEFRASGVRARAFRFLWHCLLQIKKLQGINLRALGSCNLEKYSRLFVYSIHIVMIS